MLTFFYYHEMIISMVDAGKSNYLNLNIHIFAAKLNNDPLLNLARRDATRRPFARWNLIKCSHTFATLFYRFIELLN